MLLDLKKPLLNIEGKPVRPVEVIDGKQVVLENEEIPLSRILANLLHAAKDLPAEHDRVKYLLIAEDLYRNGEVNIDEVDLKKIEDFVKKNKELPVNIGGPLERELAHARVKAIADK